MRGLIGDGVRDLGVRHRELTFRFESPEHVTAFFREYYGPTLVRRFDRIGGGGPVAIPAEYLEITAVRA